MKKVMSIAAALSVAATASFANTNYPLQVTRDGVLYNCEADTVVINGVESRRCKAAGATNASGGGGLFSSGGLGTTEAIGLGLLGLVVLGVALDDDDDATNGTN